MLIEGLKIRPLLSIHQGMLIADKMIDETNAFRAILEELNIPYDE